MGCPHKIKVRAGPNVPPPQRRPGISPPASVPSRLKIILTLILTLCRHLIFSPPFHPGAMSSAPSTHHSRARLLGWTGSRCDSVCLRSRHLVAWLCPTSHPPPIPPDCATQTAPPVPTVGQTVTLGTYFHLQADRQKVSNPLSLKAIITLSLKPPLSASELH